MCQSNITHFSGHLCVILFFLYLFQCLFPCAGQLRVSHHHVLYRFIEIKPLFRRTDTLAGTLDVVTFEQGRDDGGTGGRRTDTRILHRFACLSVSDFLAAVLHSREQGGFRIKRFGQCLFL